MAFFLPRLKTFPSYVHTRAAFIHVCDIHMAANYACRSPSIQACLSRAYASVALNHIYRMSMRRCSVPCVRNANKIHPSSHIRIRSHAQVSHSRVICLGRIRLLRCFTKHIHPKLYFESYEMD